MALSNETNLGFHLAAGVDKYLTDTDYIHYKNYDSNNATLTDFLSTIGGTSGSVAYATKVGAPGEENTNYVTASSLINLYNWWTVAAADSKTDTAINKWKEVEAFLTGITDSLTLSGLLSGRVAKAGDTMSGALTINNNLTVTGTSSLQGISGTTLNISGAATFSTPINGDLLGNATTADRLKQTEAVGSASLPVYFSGGLPVACTASSVFSSLATNTTNAVSMTVAGLTRNITAADMKTSLGLGSNAYSSTAYIPLAGNSTTAPITGVLYIKEADGLYINSSNLDKNIWHVVGGSGSWKSLYGFNLQYAGSGNGNSNDLILWAHNLTGTHVESYRIHQDGEFIFKTTPKIYKDSTSNYTILHSGNVSGGGSTWGSSITVNGTTLTIPAQPTAVSGNAGTATTLLTSRNLWGNSFNGSADISGCIDFGNTTGESLKWTSGDWWQRIYITNDSTTDSPVFSFQQRPGSEDYTDLMVIKDNGSVVATTFVGALTGNVTGNCSGSSGSCTGNASTASTLQTSRNLWGNSFNGSADISGTIKFGSAGDAFMWDVGGHRQKITVTDDGTADTAVFTFKLSSDSGTTYTDLMTIKDNGKVVANTFVGALSGNADTATKLGTTTVGASNKPIYLNNGVPTAISIYSGDSDTDRAILVCNNTSIIYSVSGITANYSKKTITALGGFIGNSLDINGTADIDSLTAGNLTVTGASTLTGDVSLGTVKSGTWNGDRLTSSYIPTDVVYTAASLALTNKTYNGFTLAGACAKAVDTSITASSTSANLPTSAAVAAFVEGKKYLTTHAKAYKSINIYKSNGARKGVISNNVESDTVFLYVEAYTSEDILKLKEGKNIKLTATNNDTAGSDELLIDVEGVLTSQANNYGYIDVWANGASSASASLSAIKADDKVTFKAGTGILLSATNGGDSADVITISAIPYNNASTLSTKLEKSLIKSSWTLDDNSIFLTTDGTASGTALPVGTYAIYIEDRSYLKDQDKPDGSGKYTADGTPNYYSGMFVCAGSAAKGRLDELALHSSMATDADTDAPTRIFAATLISNTANKHCIRLSSQDTGTEVSGVKIGVKHYLTIKVNRII